MSTISGIQPFSSKPSKPVVPEVEPNVRVNFPASREQKNANSTN